jgi:hypothetical protein
MTGINLDAILGENDPRPLVYKGQEFLLPGELPASVLAPFLTPELGLVEIIAEVLKDADEDAGVGDLVDGLFKTLSERPRLPLELIDAAKAALVLLLDCEAPDAGRSEAFFALNPSVNAYLQLGRALITDYGFGLADFFGSSDSSDEKEETGGDASPSTSSVSTDSTPEASGDVPETPAASSDSATSTT